MQVQLFVYEDEEETYVKAYIDETKITGYYFTKENDDNSVNMFLADRLLTVKKTDELITYLINKQWH